MILSTNIGKKGEILAQKYLENLGYKIITCNFHSRFGEIDIIAQEKDILVFVEVKARSNFLFGQPIEAITKKKLHKFIKTCDIYLNMIKASRNYRIDAIEVIFEENNSRINHLKNITL